MSAYNFVLGQHVRGEIAKGDKRRIVPSRITKHPGWVSDGRRGFPNDVAVVRLSMAAPIDGKTVVAGKLPTTHPKDYTKNECWISGWGRTSGGAPLPSALRHARVNVLSKTDCRNRWGSMIQDYHICIFDLASRTRGSCNGDSGGPLNCKVAGGWEVAGVTSWGIRGCSTSYPSVYARLSYFKDWIKGQTLGDELC